MIYKFENRWRLLETIKVSVKLIMDEIPFFLKSSNEGMYVSSRWCIHKVSELIPSLIKTEILSKLRSYMFIAFISLIRNVKICHICKNKVKATNFDKLYFYVGRNINFGTGCT